MARNAWKRAKTAKKKAQMFAEYQMAFQWYIHCIKSTQFSLLQTNHPKE